MKYMGLLLSTLLLSVLHICAGLFILLVASWFIAASAIAGVGFNYMLPAVVIRALAIIRIGSGYFSMLVGHNHLLKQLSVIRLRIFGTLEDKTEVSRKASIDAIAHQSEEVAGIWISWVGNNAGTILSLCIMQGGALYFLPEVSGVVGVFISMVIVVYMGLLLYMIQYAITLTKQRQQTQLSVIQHVEASPIWHMQSSYESSSPSLQLLRDIEYRNQQNIRFSSSVLFIISISTLTFVLLNYSLFFVGNALFVMLPMALLTINDWLTPSLSAQRNLVRYIESKKAINKFKEAPKPTRIFDDITSLSVENFFAKNINMPSVTATFKQGSLHLITGCSGTGKSRFLMAIAGLQTYVGQRFIYTSNLPNSNNASVQGLLNDAFYIEQFPYCLSDTLRTNMQVTDDRCSDPQILAALEKVGLDYLTNLDEWLGDNGRRLSGGEKKRLGIARALLSQANLLLIDEPFEALDSNNINHICTVLNDLSVHKIVLVATHILPAQLCNIEHISLDKR